MRSWILLLCLTAMVLCQEDAEFVCPRGCVHEADHNLAQRELHDARGEAERMRNIVRHGGAQDKSDKATGRRHYSAQDIAIGLLQESGKAADSATCGSCVKRICEDRDFATYFTEKTEVLIRDGSRAHSCVGCECAVSQISGLLLSLKQVTKYSRVVTKSYPNYVIIEDHILHSGSKAASEKEDKLHTAFARDLAAAEDVCIPSSGLKIKEAHLGDVSTVVYTVDLDNHDNTARRISVYILHH